MSGINKIIMTGNLTADPKLMHTKDGVSLCEMRMGFAARDKHGDEVCFIDVIAWEKQAESCGRCLMKGSWILVEGRLKLNEWENREGQKRSKHVLVAHKVVFLNVKGEESRGG